MQVKWIVDTLKVIRKLSFGNRLLLLNPCCFSRALMSLYYAITFHNHFFFLFNHTFKSKCCILEFLIGGFTHDWLVIVLPLWFLYTFIIFILLWWCYLKRLPLIHHNTPDLIKSRDIQLHTASSIFKVGSCVYLYIYLLLFIKDTPSLVMQLFLCVKSEGLVLNGQGGWCDLEKLFLWRIAQKLKLITIGWKGKASIAVLWGSFIF